MFDKVRGFLASLGETEPDKSDDPNAFADDDPRVAAAALMFHVVRADGVTREVELETLETLLKEEYDLEKDRLEKLIDTARQANDEAVDFFKFTSV
ncbi:MAG: TerB family tellurite resistance protein, partial [Pseudomonadota bacterium]